MTPRLVVVAPFPAELPRRIPRGSEVAIHAVGPRRAWSRSGALPVGAALLITGTCGALVEGVQAGELVAPERVIDPSGRVLAPDPALRLGLVTAAQRIGLRVGSGILCEADEVVDSAPRRDALRARTGASLVDMESASLAEFARKAGVPWAILRIVTDTPGEGLGWLADLFGRIPEDQPRVPQVLAALARRPWHLGRLVRLGIRVRRGTGAVGSILEAWAARTPPA